MVSYVSRIMSSAVTSHSAHGSAFAGPIPALDGRTLLALPILLVGVSLLGLPLAGLTTTQTG
jgi:hypothetical protein